MNRHRRDIDDLDESLFTREEAEGRRAERAEQKENHRKFEEAQAQQDAKRAAEFNEWSREKGIESIRRGYAARGVEPPCVNGDGEPTCSADLLLKMGWRIEEMPDGTKTWVRPPAPEPWTGPKDKDSLPEGGTGRRKK